MNNQNDRSSHPLRDALLSLGGKMKDWQVMSQKRDPFRLDTDAHHRDGQWFLDKITELRLSMPRHPRGLHYVFMTAEVIKPNGQVYRNTDDDYSWLQDEPLKAARWLGYVSFEDIIDNRNDEPLFVIHPPRGLPQGYVYSDSTLIVPEEFAPEAGISAPDEGDPRHPLAGDQTYRVVLWGEKSSLRPALSALARRFGADLVLDAGDDSDRHIHQLAQVLSADGRPTVILVFSDLDPSGWHMPEVLSWKLAAHRFNEFKNLDYQVHRVALDFDQVDATWGPNNDRLPNTPLKLDSNGNLRPRDAKWVETTGHQQTEIDALAAVHPEAFSALAEAAIAPFYDGTLTRRAEQAQARWERAAQRAIEEQADHDLRADVEAELAELKARAEELVGSVEDDLNTIELPAAPDRVTPVLTGAQPEPLVDSRWSFRDQAEALMESRRQAGMDDE